MKDNNNILNHNAWSVGEYNHTITEFLPNVVGCVNIESTNQYSSIGEESLKLTRLSQNGYSMYLLQPFTEHNVLVTVSATYKTSNNDAVLMAIEQGNNVNHQVFTTIPANTTQKTTITLTTGDAVERLRLQLYTHDVVGSSIFVDDLKITYESI